MSVSGFLFACASVVTFVIVFEVALAGMSLYVCVHVGWNVCV